MITDYTIRLEEPRDYSVCENLVREAFWNVYRPGCSEHYVLHVLRSDPAFVPELDFVMECKGKLIGQVMFMRSEIILDDGTSLPTLTMGPICILPAYKRQGLGKALLDFALDEATKLGFGAVCIEGNIEFYKHSGFVLASRFGLRYQGVSEGEDAPFFLCRELTPHYLEGITGVYEPPQGYFVSEEDVEAFDAHFPPKEKLKLAGQLLG